MGSDFAYDTLLRYVINTAASIAAGYFGLDAAQTQKAESLTFAALSALVALGVWVWGIYRSSRKQKMLDVATSPNTVSTVKTAIANANPDLKPKIKEASNA